MKSYDQLESKIKTIQQQMVEAENNERAHVLNEIKLVCKEFDFTDEILKILLVEGRKTRSGS